MTIRRFLRLRQAAAVALAAALAACGGSPADGRRTGTPGASGSGDPVADCAQVIAYWARQLTTPGSDWGLDYQEMGLSDGENNILQHLMPDARRLARQQGPDAVQSAVRRAAERPCRAYAASLPSSPTGPPNGWPQ